MLTFGIWILVVVNIFAFIQVGIDKKQSLINGARIPEGWIFFWAVIFGSLGVFLGMLLFRHKIRKIYFALGVVLLILEQLFILSKFIPIL